MGALNAVEAVGEVTEGEAGRVGDARQVGGQVQGGQQDAVLGDVGGVVVVPDRYRQRQAGTAELGRRAYTAPDQGSSASTSR